MLKAQGSSLDPFPSHLHPFFSFTPFGCFFLSTSRLHSNVSYGNPTTDDNFG